MPTGVVYTTFHYPVTGANVVTTENSDWATNCPEYKVTAVQVALAHPVVREDDQRTPSTACWPRTGGLICRTRRPCRDQDGQRIAAHFGYLRTEQAAAAVADHIRKFWDPRMKQRLLLAHRLGTRDLDPVAARRSGAAALTAPAA